jgi:NSS family neurotransmitter:Na+ symporter
MEKERARWDSRSAFILAAVGSAVGLGNVWRFPFVTYQNGGGAFLIPFFVAMITAGIPLLVLEYGLGHRMQGGAPFSFAQVSDKSEWIGWWAVLMGFGLTCYYVVIMAWCFGYLIHSFTLAWGADASTYFYQDFLQLTDGPQTLGGIRPFTLLGLIVVWVAIFFIIIKGVKSVGKVVLITVPLPWLCLLILVIRGVTLPGAAEGLRYFLTPDFGALLNPKVWLAAYSQIFFSFSIGFGVMIAYASYLPKRSDVTNNAIMTGFADSLTSFLAGFAVFSALGYLAQMQGVAITEVAQGGPGLAFVTYPTIIRLLPFGASIFGVVFFLMLLTLGIDSAFSLVEAVVTGGMEKWRISRKKANLGVCLLAFAGGLVFATKGGLFWLDIVDHFLSNFGLVLVGILECVGIGYIYKASRMRDHVNQVSEIQIGKWWDFAVRYLTPIILIILMALTLIERIQTPYENYPQWALFLGGWLVLLVTWIASLVLSRR